MKYRAEIDGLRALAVLPVIFFHAGFEPFNGGFVGVDVFFVISGYLITSLILEELKTNRFSLASFYDRRARRILPALIFVVICSIPVAWFILLPENLNEFFYSVTAVGAFSSNILFWFQSGYFDTMAELKPLLHTWSLAVEEQFYIIFPLLLMGLYRFGYRILIWVLTILFGVSLCIAHWGAYAYPSATFFLLHTRGWELLIGAFSAFYLQSMQKTVPTYYSGVLSAIGLLAIFASVIFFSERTPFPSLYALMPTLGAALVILFAVPGTFVHWILGLKVCVGIGLISYSMYLWHQPLFVFSRYLFGLQQGSYLFLGLTLVTMTLAWFSWRFVERPFREKRFRVRYVLFAAATASLAIMSLGNSLPKFKNQIFDELDLQTQWQGWTACHPFGGWEQAGGRCSILLEDTPPTLAIIGDSHAQHLVFGVRKALAETSENPIAFVSGGCYPVITQGREFENFMQCNQDFIDRSFAYTLENEKITKVILSGYGVWELLRKRAHDRAYLKPAEIELRQALMLEGMRKTVEMLLAGGKKVMLITDSPEMIANPAHCSTKTAGWFGQCPYRISRSDVDASMKEMDQIIRELQNDHPALVVFDPRSVLCDENYCYSGRPHENWYRDHDHFTPAGSEIVINSALPHFH